MRAAAEETTAAHSARPATRIIQLIRFRPTIWKRRRCIRRRAFVFRVDPSLGASAQEASEHLKNVV